MPSGNPAAFHASGTDRENWKQQSCPDQPSTS
jgi:hypothetical protein